MEALDFHPPFSGSKDGFFQILLSFVMKLPQDKPHPKIVKTWVKLHGLAHEGGVALQGYLAHKNPPPRRTLQ